MKEHLYVYPGPSHKHEAQQPETPTSPLCSEERGLTQMSGTMSHSLAVDLKDLMATAAPLRWRA